MRPFFAWLVFCEPFLLIYALCKNPPASTAIKSFWKFILVIAFLQLPLGLWQVLKFGLGDDVQGTFIKMGAGAHVAGAVTAIGSLICFAKVFEAGSSARRYLWLVAGFALLVFPVIADAKQVLVAFLPALVFMTLKSSYMRHSLKVVIVSIAVAILAYNMAIFSSLFHLIGDWDYITRGIVGKIDSVTIIAQKMSDSFYGWFIGLGPGNSVSRVALLSVNGIVKEGSPVSLLGFHLSPITRDIIYLSWKSNQLFASSSVWSGVSSWLGLFGDFGFLGLGLYLSMAWKLWRSFARLSGWDVLATKAAIIMAGVLGAMFSWLEEPGFTLLVALMVGLTLVSNKARRVET